MKILTIMLLGLISAQATAGSIVEFTLYSNYKKRPNPAPFWAPTAHPVWGWQQGGICTGANPPYPTTVIDLSSGYEVSRSGCTTTYAYCDEGILTNTASGYYCLEDLPGRCLHHPNLVGDSLWNYANATSNCAGPYSYGNYCCECKQGMQFVSSRGACMPADGICPLN